VKFPQYWTRVKNESGRVVARGWSETSQDEALANAKARLNRILDYLRSDRPLDEYQYVFDHVICEEVIDRIFDGDEDAEAAVISRNAYGSLVMNTPRLMFIDIDLPKPATGLGERIKSWFSRSTDTTSPEQRALDEIRRWQAANDQYTLRVYRTRAGYRLLLVNRCFDGADETAMRILDELKSDRLYRRLCLAQQCFRARLSPKPWRVAAGNLPGQFPFANESLERQFHAWLDRYTRLAAAFSVCHYVETLGHDSPHDGVIALIEYHDSLSSGSRPLA
jgi:hypothetical protein